eukprot:TRINITY_DN62913_c0_g1_i1.p1 TRINITY_DN62913_c0_g1~~TRINITY_DN62913_c0_g1_i1.p1  ORF type:complete len:634 (+),score=81.80 TRINITY_DN62913_c0_g1_i1:122-2023(+)
MSYMKGVKETDCRWQWKGRQEWLCFSDLNSTKVQQAHLMHRPGINIWDGGSMRELDFGNMRALPGRQPLRFAPPPPPLGKPTLKKNPPKRKETQYEQTRGMRDADNVAIMPAGLRVLSHPCFIDLEKPRFTYHDGPENEHRSYVWERELDLCEDSADLIVLMSNIYSELLDHSEKIELPCLGTPSQMMGALALALHRGGAMPCLDKRFWWLSRKRAPLTKLPDPTDNLGLPSSRPSTNRSSATGSVAASVNGMSKSTSLPIIGFGSGKVTAAKARPPPDASAFITFRLETGSPCEDRDFSLKLIKAWNDWKTAALENNAVEIPRLCRMERFNAEDFDRCEDQEDGDFEWIKMANEPETRVIRLASLCTTLWYSVVSPYAKTIPSRIKLMSVSMRHCGGNTVSTGLAFQPNFRVSPGLSSIENAMLQQDCGQRAAAVLICNDERMGGNFFNGYATTIEEDFLMKSDLYSFFVEAKSQSEQRRIRDTYGQICHIPEDGCLCCSDVRVLREDYQEGFRPLAEPRVIPQVICITLRNLNPYRDPSAQSRVFIANFDKQQYEKTLKAKFEMVLQGAHEAGIEMLCISEMGCKELFIDAASFGAALGKALKKTRVKPPSIVLSGASKFISAIKRAISED